MTSFTLLTLTYGRVRHLENAIACFLSQDYKGPAEMLIVNSCPQQTLTVPEIYSARIRVVNLANRPPNLGTCRNIGIANARGTHIVILDDDDACLPSFLTFYHDAFQRKMSNHWIWPSRQFYAEGNRIAKIVQATKNAVAFTTEAWKQCGEYPPINVGEDSQFVGKLTSFCSGEIVDIDEDKIPGIYCWGQGSHHISGQGNDQRGKVSSYTRAEQDLKARIRSKSEPSGDILVQPKFRCDWNNLACDFLMRNGWMGDKTDGLAVIQLGRMGDIINTLPILKKLHDDGRQPHLLVSREFSPLLDGVSYVNAVELDLPFDQLGDAMRYARANYTDVLRLQIYGKGHKQEVFTPAFNMEQWREAGMLDEFHNPELKPVFDKRNLEREAGIVRKLFRTSKPKIVTNLTKANTSPFERGPQLLTALKRHFQGTHEVVDIGGLRTHRLYDLLGVIEKAELFISIDTATLHLAAATDTPVIGLISNIPWAGSAIRYNQVATFLYREATTDRVISEVAAFLHARGCGEYKTPLDALRVPIKLRPPPLYGVTLWACCWSNDLKNYIRTLRVLRYCQTLFRFDRVVLFAYLPCPTQIAFPLEIIQIPKLDPSSWNIFHNKIVPHFIHTDFAMSVHEDGFPLDATLWDDKFLAYDFIGAPWKDGVVGNAGFCIESRKLMQEKLKLPPATEPILASDVYFCRQHRAQLERRGIKFAPAAFAETFSTELTGKDNPSFGYHGRVAQPKKYVQGWKLIEGSEK